MVYVSIFIFFIAVFCLIYGIFSITTANKLFIHRRLEQVKGIQAPNHKNQQAGTFFERAGMPIYHGISNLFLRITPGYKLADINKKLERAGMLKNKSAERWLFTKYMTAFIIGILCALLVYILEPSILKAFFIAVLVTIFINVFFTFNLSKKIDMRKRLILRDLPYTLDLITVSVEAGLSFDGAMARVAGSISGELCDEFAKSLKEIKMGIERKTALRNMSTRCEVDDLSMLVTSLIQADELGVSLGKVLRIEASNLREKRKQAAREKAMKAPVKMLFPLVFFIFPSIFIVILGPAVIQIINIFVFKK